MSKHYFVTWKIIWSGGEIKYGNGWKINFPSERIAEGEKREIYSDDPLSILDTGSAGQRLAGAL